MFAEKEGIEFPFLLDLDGSTFQEWGIASDREPTVPHPTVLVVGEDGVVDARWTDVDYKVRPSADEVLAALRAD